MGTLQNLARLLNEYKSALNKALDHLDYSYKKVRSLPSDPVHLNEESLETWESFTARVARVVDLFTSKYIQTYVRNNDPGFSGSLRDFVNQAEKLGLIESADEWMAARGLRNITAHEYKNESLKVFFEALLEFTPKALKIRSKL